MNSKARYLILVVFVAALLLGGLSLGMRGSVSAAAAIPTPVANDTVSTAARYPVAFFSAARKTADAASSSFTAANVERWDLQYVVDQGTTPNTLTLKIQFSNDGTNWVDGLSLLSSSTTDQNNLVQLNNFGIYTRLYADVSNTQPVTITAIAVGK